MIRSPIVRLADCAPVTVGGLVFDGSGEGNFNALDAMTGKPLWEFQTDGFIAANPISFLVEGKH